VDSQVSKPEFGGGAEVTIEHIGRTYGDFVAVRDVSLVASAGEFFTILGPSGSGKTTTLMMVAGFTSPSRGRVLLDGKDVTGLPPQARDIGMVFQNYALFPHLSVFDNVAFPLRVRKADAREIDRKVATMLEMVRLTGFEKRLPQQLSGGQQQRVALARALVFHPRLVLLDEPLGALDKKLRAQMQLEIKQIQQRLRLTVIYITHDQEEALTMSDRVAVMNAGQVEQIGAPDELYERPANRFVADFLGESNFIEGVVGATRGGMIRVDAAGLSFWGTSAADVAQGQKVIAALRPEKLVLSAEAPDNNEANGRIEDTIYVGDATRYRVRLDGNAEVIAKIQNRAGIAPCAIGQLVTLAWSPRDTYVFAADDR
jgi:putative spermidine/putrescine transport system ATP-binding protein